MKKTLPIQGMHCASCAKIITDKLGALPGVHSCEVHFATKQATLDYDDTTISSTQLNTELQKYGYTLTLPDDSMKAHHDVGDDPIDDELQQATRRLYIAVPITTTGVITMIIMIGMQYGRRPTNILIMSIMEHILPIMATIFISTIGWKYIIAIGRYMRYGVANMDTLIGLGTSIAFIYSLLASILQPFFPEIFGTQLFYEAVTTVIGFIELGKYMEHKVMSKTGKAIKALIGLQAKSALIIDGDSTKEVPLDQVKLGDIMLVKAGEKIPLDGEVTQGTAHIDESMLTGEPLPVSKTIGDNVIGSTIVQDSTLYVRANALGSETYLSKIITIVQQAQNSKPSIQKLADRIMAYFVPGVLVIAVLSALFWLFLGVKFFPEIQPIQYAVMSFVGVLVIACPCGLGLATPMAIITGVGHGAKNGILAKNAEGLLKLRTTNIVVFDKTGTITAGKPKLVEISPDAEQYLPILASLESESTHPIAHAIVSYAGENNIDIPTTTESKNLQGIGIQGTIEGTTYLISKSDHLDALGISYDHDLIDTRTLQGKTPLILTSGVKLLGYYAVADEVKTESKTAIEQLKAQGITPVMLTGDHENTARYIADLVGIDRIYAQVTPEGKADIVKQLQKEGIVTMVGDGINDAPALATADIGIAMSTGTDVAIESADLTLLHGDLSKLVKAIKISKLTQSAIIQNLAWAFGFNLIGIPLAAGVFYPILGVLLNPAFEGAAMAFSDLTVVGNSLRLQAKKI